MLLLLLYNDIVHMRLGSVAAKKPFSHNSEHRISNIENENENEHTNHCVADESGCYHYQRHHPMRVVPFPTPNANACEPKTDHKSFI